MAKAGWTIYINKRGLRGSVLCVWGDAPLAQALGYKEPLQPEEQVAVDKWEKVQGFIDRIWCEGALQMYEMRYVPPPVPAPGKQDVFGAEESTDVETEY